MIYGLSVLGALLLVRTAVPHEQVDRHRHRGRDLCRCRRISQEGGQRPACPSPVVGGGSSSVRYRGASLCAFSANSASVSPSKGGGASVRVATGCPTRVKKSSCPAGAHMHSS